jgi:UDP-N-acetylmuramate: L-alanyl-gamma-D-glutamyl-meso-diaminopimelate ligase
MSGKKILPSLDELKHVHIVGVCGTLMGAFAAFLRRRGIKVTGSDQNVYPPMSDVLREAGVILLNGYDATHLSEHGPGVIDLVVIGNVVRSDNPEAREAIDRGYAYSSLPEAMEELMLKQTRNLVVSGTHGKTTSSGLLSYVLKSCGCDPNYFIGGVVKDLPFSFNVSSIERGHPFVLEGDEYDTAFWDKVPKFNHYLPDDVILTSVEYDHADIYPDFQAVFRAFEGLVSRIRSGGRMICCLDYPAIRELLQKARVPVISYASQPGPLVRFSPSNIRVENGLTHFTVCDGGREVEELLLDLPGNHNVMNALAVWIECRELGLPAERVREALRTFKGVRRRQEVRGEVRDVLVLDDFAHHPTAVKETLAALRMKYPQRRLVAVFEPRSATSRRKVFQRQYAEAFDSASAAFIAIPYDQSRIASADQFSTEQLIQDVNNRSGREFAFSMRSVEVGVLDVARFARAGDLIAVLSNGGFGGFIPKLLEALKGNN